MIYEDKGIRGAEFKTSVKNGMLVVNKWGAQQATTEVKSTINDSLEDSLLTENPDRES